MLQKPFHSLAGLVRLAEVGYRMSDDSDDEVTQTAPLLQLIQLSGYTRNLGELTAEEQGRVGAFIQWAKGNERAPDDPAATIALLCARRLNVPIDAIDVEDYERHLFSDQQLNLGVLEIPILAGHARWSLAKGNGGVGPRASGPGKRFGWRSEQDLCEPNAAMVLHPNST